MFTRAPKEEWSGRCSLGQRCQIFVNAFHNDRWSPEYSAVIFTWFHLWHLPIVEVCLPSKSWPTWCDVISIPDTLQISTMSFRSQHFRSHPWLKRHFGFLSCVTSEAWRLMRWNITRIIVQPSFWLPVKFRVDSRSVCWPTNSPWKARLSARVLATSPPPRSLR